ncbi:hypothetical protein OG585_36355 [Streptomyces sp. NBC_01340]|uniref:hypothetical protein n=1 Tax=Streptomyces sp. NBC_01728 TaxID=2975925 RepID=UPI00224F92F6|nr:MULTISPECIES: hypothetical protein [unclassified Streptomyces]MCX4458016.1 hypothetical protein [Streptomyces sp. NBC_01719]MCX4497373.1 hypothetical protein [Streptomyces sp. NBC_01728]WSI42220.1 hypothetical protein OG585_36355 [Streptomyces sp. NBC_01340]
MHCSRRADGGVPRPPRNTELNVGASSLAALLAPERGRDAGAPPRRSSGYGALAVVLALRLAGIVAIYVVLSHVTIIF